jgi:hypothetical protein
VEHSFDYIFHALNNLVFAFCAKLAIFSTGAEIKQIWNIASLSLEAPKKSSCYPLSFEQSVLKNILRERARIRRLTIQNRRFQRQLIAA